MPTIRRTLKNVVKNYSDAQVKVREATSNDPWGPSSTLMSEIADLTYNVVAFTEIMQMVWKRLNDDGKNWRHVYKSLMVLDYIIRTGSEKVAQQCKENFHAIKTLTSFQYIDLDNKDQGMNVREKAKQLVALLSDDERLKNERAKSLKAKERFAQNAMGIGSNGRIKSPGADAAETSGTHFGTGSPTMPSSTGYSDTVGGAGSNFDDMSPASSTAGRRLSTDLEHARPSSAGEEELQLQLALAMSKEEHDEEVRKQKSDDIKLQMAIDESKRHADDEPPEHPHRNVKLRQGGHARETTDPWGMPLQNSAPTDPWGAPLAAAAAVAAVPRHSPQQQDAWGSPVAQPPPPTLNSDPWHPQPVNSSKTNTQTGAPPASPWTAPQWGSPASNAQQGTGLDAFSSPPPPATNGTNNIDDAFDLLSSRSAEDSPAKSGAASAAQAFDPLASTSEENNSTWNMDPINQSLPERKKSPMDFLGAHTGLVNLDQLVSKDPSKGNNPFTAPASNNPFEVPTSRVPMSQLQNTQPGFSQPVSAGLLPTPLIPVNTAQHMQAQPQGYNPFL